MSTHWGNQVQSQEGLSKKGKSGRHEGSVGYVRAKALQLCLSLCDPKDCNPPGSSVHEILQARILGWVAMPSSRLALLGKPSVGSVQLFSCVLLFATPWTATRQPSLSITNSLSLPKLMSIESVMSSNLLLLPSIFPSIRVFSNESTLCIRWPKYWSFSFNISPSNEHPGLIFFRMNWLDLLAVQGTLKSLLQHHSSKASILQCSAFFTVQLSHPYMTAGKTIALTRQKF